MKKRFCLICLALINIISLKAQTLRNTVVLNGNWRFITDSANAGQAKQWAKGLPGTAVNVQVPHTWNVMKGLEDYIGLAWYEKEFTLPAQYRNRQMRLKFEAIYHDAIIYLNGVQLATHTNAGYTTFYVDITNQVKATAANKLVIAVNNAFSDTNLPYKKKFDWCADGGIIRGVHLQVTGKPSIKYVHITPDLNLTDSTAKAAINLKLWEDDITAVQAVVRINEKKSGKNLYNQKLALSMSGNEFTGVVDLGKVHLWHFNDPFLYQVQLTLENNAQPTDQLPSYIVRDFMVSWPNGKNKLLQQKLPTLKPGETFIFTLNDMNARAGFDICTPAGYRVMSYPFVH